MPYIALYFKAFYKYYSSIIFEKCVVFFLDFSIVLVKIYISCIIINRGKSTFELVGTILMIITGHFFLGGRGRGRGGNPNDEGN